MQSIRGHRERSGRDKEAWYKLGGGQSRRGERNSNFNPLRPSLQNVLSLDKQVATDLAVRSPDRPESPDIENDTKGSSDERFNLCYPEHKSLG